MLVFCEYHLLNYLILSHLLQDLSQLHSFSNLLLSRRKDLFLLFKIARGIILARKSFDNQHFKHLTIRQIWSMQACNILVSSILHSFDKASIKVIKRGAAHRSLMSTRVRALIANFVILISRCYFYLLLLCRGFVRSIIFHIFV